MIFYVVPPVQETEVTEETEEHYHPSASTSDHVPNESGPQQDGATSLLRLSTASNSQSDPEWSEADKLFGENFMKERAKQWEVTKMLWAKESAGAGKCLKLLKKEKR